MLEMMNNFVSDSKLKYFMVKHDFLQLSELKLVEKLPLRTSRLL